MIFCCLFWYLGHGQMKHIQYEQHRTDTLLSENPFRKFVGEWTLKEDRWIHNWGGTTDTIQIKGHHTVTTALNTANSLLSIIDGPAPNGQLYWSYNPITGSVDHLSSFGPVRAGVGHGSVSKNGDVTLRITFEGEPKGTYRVYHYRWLSANEYHMKSVQYDHNDSPTGLFYEGNFIRISQSDSSTRSEIERILAVLDDHTIPIAQQLEAYHEQVVHMAPDTEEILGKKALGTYLQTQRSYGKVVMEHHIDELEIFGGLVLMRGGVSGRFYPNDGGTTVRFKTKNLFVFERVGGRLRIKKLIYNSSPIP